MLSIKTGRKILGVFTDRVPVTLYRIQNGKSVALRDKAIQQSKKRTSFDLVLSSKGLVEPLLNNENFIRPNGMSTRPNGPMLQELVRNFSGNRVVLVEIPEGTLIPQDLVILHEHTDHYSFQSRVEMRLEDLNAKLTAFLIDEGKWMSPDDFCKENSFEDSINQ